MKKDDITVLALNPDPNLWTFREICTFCASSHVSVQPQSGDTAIAVRMPRVTTPNKDMNLPGRS